MYCTSVIKDRRGTNDLLQCIAGCVLDSDLRFQAAGDLLIFEGKPEFKSSGENCKV